MIEDERKETLASRQANAAVALLRMNATDKVWPLMKHQPDPRLRTFVIHLLTDLELEPQRILDRLNVETEISARRALVLAVGEYAKAGLLSEEQQSEWKSKLLTWFREERDGGLHSACSWTLGQMEADGELSEIRKELATGSVIGDRQWYLTKQGQHTMMILEPGEFLMGSPITDKERWQEASGTNEALHGRRIDHRVAFSAHEVTVEQFLAFAKNHSYSAQYSPTKHHPINGISWYAAARYCNWLSEQEGLPREQWCYDPDQSFSDGMRMYPDMLERTGYRLPTEAEWEYACRAGSVTKRFSGESERELGNYVWYSVNSNQAASCPVEALKPSDWGLFSTIGNVYEWTHTPNSNYRYRLAEIAKTGEMGKLNDKVGRLIRGGSFGNRSSNVRSSDRVFNSPDVQNSASGFRISRTYR